MLLEILERRFLFQPRPVCEARPTDLGLDYEESWAETGDGRRLHCWYIPGDDRADLTWLWFGGIGGNLSLRVGEFGAVRKHTGANIFGFDYGGFGYSSGKATVGNTAVDARTALAHLQERYGAPPDGTLYLGVSMGAAVALRLAAESTGPRGVALVAPFASLREMARRRHPVITLGGWLVRSRYNSLACVGSIGCPLLILHGGDDDIVPAAQARKLYSAAEEPKEYAEIAGVGHLDIGDAPEFWEALREWVDGIATRGQTPLINSEP